MSEVEIVRATVRGTPHVVAMHCSPKYACNWVTVDAHDGQYWHTDEMVTERIPLRLVDESKEVVIDPEDVSDLAHNLMMECLESDIRQPEVSEALRFMLKSSKMDEPLEFGAKVTDIHGKRWLHVSPGYSGGWCCEGMMALGQWSDIIKPTLGWADE